MGLANIHKRFGNENYIIIRHTKSVPESVPGSVPGSVPDSENVKHKEIIIRKNGNQLKVSDYIERFDRGCTLLDQYTYTEITEDTLKNEHKYLDVLFSSLDQKPKPKTFTERFTSSKSKLKWFVREALLDTTLVGGLVGKIIAFSANRENPHYTTIASRILAKTLGPLIFPAGYKAATVSENVISVDAIIHKQLKALKNYTGEHRGIEFENIEGVTVKLGNRELNLTTIAAENKIKPHEGGQPLHIIYFNGNSGCFEQDYKQVAEDLLVYETDKKAVKAIMFNYPGVLCPDGTQRVERAQDLVDAGIAQVERLLDDGVLEENIVLHGVSLGGSVASHVAAHFNAEGTPLAGVYASRTFASTAQVGKNFFNRALGNNIFSKFISTICLPFIKLGTWGSEWDLDTGKAFFSLPKDRRDYAVVTSPQKFRQLFRENEKLSRTRKVFNFIFRISVLPADDAVLRRGLHDSWERRFDKLLTKIGWYGQEAKKSYSSENRGRKMIVVDFENKNENEKGNEKVKLLQKTCGHAKAAQVYNDSDNNKWYDPKKDKKVHGLVHHTEEKYTEANLQSDFTSNEAGARARDRMWNMYENANEKV